MISVRSTAVQPSTLARLTDSQVARKARDAIGNVVTDSLAAGTSYSMAGLGAWNVWAQLAGNGGLVATLASGAAVAVGLAAGVLLSKSAIANGQANVDSVREPLEHSIVDQCNARSQVTSTILGATILPAVCATGDGVIAAAAIAALSAVSTLTASVPAYCFLRKSLMAQRNEARQELLAPYKAS